NDTSSTATSPPNATETWSHSSMPPPPEPRAQDAVRKIDRHQHQGGAVHEQPVLAEESERFREDRQDDAADDRSEEGGGAAENRREPEAAVDVPERHERRDPHEAQRPAGDREVEGNDADDFAEGQRRDGQVDPAQPEGRDADDRRDGGREPGAAEQGGPERG